LLSPPCFWSGCCCVCGVFLLGLFAEERDLLFGAKFVAGCGDHLCGGWQVEELVVGEVGGFLVEGGIAEAGSIG
jgi:hypothetical protein